MLEEQVPVTVPEAPVSAPDSPAPVQTLGGSLKDRIAQRRRELQQEKAFTIPISGYEDMLAARYRVLDYKEYRRIGRRAEVIDDPDEAELVVYADTLINACEELLEVRVDGTRVPTGQKWSAVAVRSLLGVELPDRSTARQSIRAVLSDNDLALHFRAYDLKSDSVGPAVEKSVEGEPGAA